MALSTRISRVDTASISDKEHNMIAQGVTYVAAFSRNGVDLIIGDYSVTIPEPVWQQIEDARREAVRLQIDDARAEKKLGPVATSLY